MSANSQRIASVDIFRALTMLIMLWVNDFAGMAGIPHWLCHAGMDEDMLGFSDLVFPAFLFCVGMSIPFAIRTRYRKGDSHLQVLTHIAVRTAALLIMGVFSMNLKGVEGGLSRQTFTLLAVAGYFLLWNVYPKRNGRAPRWTILLKALGAALLIFLVIYKDCNGTSFKVGWWGILGLIGWSYLACALIYIFTNGKFKSVVTAWAAVILLCLLNSAPFIPKEFFSRAIILGFYPGGWTHVALTASGMVASAMLMRYVEETSGEEASVRSKSARRMLVRFFLIALLMFLLGLISHKVWIVSKILATPTWFFFCTAIYFPLFALLYWVADIKGKQRWARLTAPAGTATLTCYTIPYIWYAVQQMLGLRWPAALSSGTLGLVRSMIFAFIIIFLTWIFGKCRIKMKI